MPPELSPDRLLAVTCLTPPHLQASLIDGIAAYVMFKVGN